MQRSCTRTTLAKPVATLLPRSRRRKTKRVAIENDLLEQLCWAGLRQPQRPQSRNHTSAENDGARRPCLEFLHGGTAPIAQDCQGSLPMSLDLFSD